MERTMALGAGFLVGSALFALLPEATHPPEGPLFVGLGYFGLFLLQQLVRARKGGSFGPSHETAWGAVMGMMLHSLLDGAALGVAVQAGGRPGAIALAAVGLHKIPEVLSCYMAVLAGTGARKAAAFGGGMVLVATGIGAVLAAVWSGLAQVPHAPLLGIGTGSLLYVGTVQMLPALEHPRHRWLVLVGAAVAYWIAFGGLVPTHAHQH